MLKRLSLYTFLLCLVPIFVWIFSWKWAGDTHLTRVDYFLYWLTETGSSPYALITCGVFVFLFAPIFPTRKKWILAVVVMALATGVTQGVKSVAKTVFAEPRPFIIELTEKSGVSTEYFYDQKKKQRELLVNRFYADKPETPEWLSHHRENEVGYSFPSGHTIFAVTWLLLAVGFTEIYGRCRTVSKILVAGIFLWALFMLVSRLRLGMHHPIDLLVSTLLAWAINCSVFWYLRKKTIFIKE